MLRLPELLLVVAGLIAVAPVMLGAPRAVAEALAARINQVIADVYRVP